MSDTRVYSCDFDGLLCDDAWPEIGRPHMDTIDSFINLQGARDNAGRGRVLDLP